MLTMAGVTLEKYELTKQQIVIDFSKANSNDTNDNNTNDTNST